jgi:hypothetical protein
MTQEMIKTLANEMLILNAKLDKIANHIDEYMYYIHEEMVADFEQRFQDVHDRLRIELFGDEEQ